MKKKSNWMRFFKYTKKDKAEVDIRAYTCEVKNYYKKKKFKFRLNE